MLTMMMSLLGVLVASSFVPCVVGYLGGIQECQLMGVNYGVEVGSQVCESFVGKCQTNQQLIQLVVTHQDRQQLREQVSGLSNENDCYRQFYDKCFESCESARCLNGYSKLLPFARADDVYGECAVSVRQNVDYACSKVCQEKAYTFTKMDVEQKQTACTDEVVVIGNKTINKDCNKVKSQDQPKLTIQPHQVLAM
eukprot:TRINITY_DN3616_c0_g1_i10.p3 TRINITY_DN3616_c0_g1~~TRINITY_DN3616_c0_g1_i10.p3  ORF type:complete len:213 (-),score=17.30 TRINITY_DN3616_c0_g1_i10:2166-2753(-)